MKDGEIDSTDPVVEVGRDCFGGAEIPDSCFDLESFLSVLTRCIGRWHTESGLLVNLQKLAPENTN